jgi:hypothetical protein
MSKVSTLDWVTYSAGKMKRIYIKGKRGKDRAYRDRWTANIMPQQEW